VVNKPGISAAKAAPRAACAPWSEDNAWEQRTAVLTMSVAHLESPWRGKGLLLPTIWLRMNLSKNDRERLKLHST
jgi:hypothetical protein